MGHHTLTPTTSERYRPFTVVPVIMNLLPSYSGLISSLLLCLGLISSLLLYLGLDKQFTIVPRTCNYGVVDEFASTSVFVMCYKMACT